MAEKKSASKSGKPAQKKGADKTAAAEQDKKTSAPVDAAAEKVVERTGSEGTPAEKAISDPDVPRDAVSGDAKAIVAQENAAKQVPNAPRATVADSDQKGREYDAGKVVSTQPAPLEVTEKTNFGGIPYHDPSVLDGVFDTTGR